MIPIITILLAWWIVVAPSQSVAPTGATLTAEHRDLGALAGAVFLGQGYPSGRVYLEAFGDLGNHRSGLGEWPDHILLVPLDGVAALPTMTPARSHEARYVRAAARANPPELEGMLDADSPCVEEGYRTRAGASYFTRDLAGHPGQTADYFGTLDWYGCQVEPEVPIYQMELQPEQAFRVLAFRPELELATIDYSVGRSTRPMTKAEAEEVAMQRAQDHECTLEPRRLDESRQIVRITTRSLAYVLRLSSHVQACTSLAEVFVLDILEGDEVVATLRSTRWRGNP